MRKKYLALAVLAGAGTLAFVGTSSAGAWDDLPCGDTEQTAHVCAPGEMDRSGNIPVPLPPPVVSAPAPVPVVTPPPPLASSVVVTPVVTPRPTPKVHKPKTTARVITCAWLNRHNAGPRRYTARGFYYRCQAPTARITTPAVTG